MSQAETRTPVADDVTVLSRNTEIVGGTLRVAHDLTVRGVLEGDVRVGGKVVVASGARVVGTLHAREAIIAGTVRGDVTVAETLTLRSTAVVDGAAHAARLVVEEGSSGDVNLRIGEKEVLDLLESRRAEARAELDRVRSKGGVTGDGAGDHGKGRESEGSVGVQQGTSTEVAIDDPGRRAEGGVTSEQLLESDEMGEFLTGESRTGDRSSAAVEGETRPADQ